MLLVPRDIDSWYLKNLLDSFQDQTDLLAASCHCSLIFCLESDFNSVYYFVAQFKQNQ